MADFHVLHSDENGNGFLVAYHLPVPNTLNLAGITYQAALSEHLGKGDPSTITSIVPSIGAELADLQSGAILEIVEKLDSNPTETLISKRDRMIARHAELVSEMGTKFTNMLSYYGYSYSS